jgi:hypothetical protein
VAFEVEDATLDFRRATWTNLPQADLGHSDFILLQLQHGYHDALI